MTEVQRQRGLWCKQGRMRLNWQEAVVGGGQDLQGGRSSEFLLSGQTALKPGSSPKYGNCRDGVHSGQKDETQACFQFDLPRLCGELITRCEVNRGKSLTDLLQVSQQQVCSSGQRTCQTILDWRTRVVSGTKKFRGRKGASEAEED